MAGHNVPAIFVFAHFVIPGRRVSAGPGIQRGTTGCSGFRVRSRSLSSGRASRGPVGSRPGMTGQVFKQPSAIARILCGAGCAVVPFRPPRTSRGDGAPQGASIQLTPCGVRVLGEGRAPRGAPSRLFCPRGRNFRAWTGGLRPPRSGQLSPPFIRAASSHQRQSLIVGTDGDPRPPGSGVTSPARRRRTWLHLQDVPRRRPQPSQASWNIILS